VFISALVTVCSVQVCLISWIVLIHVNRYKWSAAFILLVAAAGFLIVSFDLCLS